MHLIDTGRITFPRVGLYRLNVKVNTEVLKVDQDRVDKTSLKPYLNLDSVYTHKRSTILVV